MCERVVKVSYLNKLRDEGDKAYAAKLRLEVSQKRDAYMIADAAAKVHSQHAPTEHYFYADWLNQLTVKANEVSVLLDAYNAAEAAASDYSEHPDYAQFCLRYSLQHYAPTDDDFESVPSDPADGCSLIKDAEPPQETESHATPLDSHAEA